VTPPPVVISSRNDVKKKSWWGGHTPGHVGARWCLVKMYALETIGRFGTIQLYWLRIIQVKSKTHIPPPLANREGPRLYTPIMAKI
jgi:hypothetical protein